MKKREISNKQSNDTSEGFREGKKYQRSEQK
jgi:hypothetical protein